MMVKMMIKIVEITRCDECPHFDDFYYTYNEECTLLNRKIKRDGINGDHPISEDCPLEDKK